MMGLDGPGPKTMPRRRLFSRTRLPLAVPSLLLPRALSAQLCACLFHSRLCRYTPGHAPSPAKAGHILGRDVFIAALGASSWEGLLTACHWAWRLGASGTRELRRIVGWGLGPPSHLPPYGGLESVAVCEGAAGPLPPPFAPTSPSA